jgi:hypothetical protein
LMAQSLQLVCLPITEAIFRRFVPFSYAQCSVFKEQFVLHVRSVSEARIISYRIFISDATLNFFQYVRIY